MKSIQLHQSHILIQNELISTSSTQLQSLIVHMDYDSKSQLFSSLHDEHVNFIGRHIFGIQNHSFAACVHACGTIEGTCHSCGTEGRSMGIFLS